MVVCGCEGFRHASLTCRGFIGFEVSGLGFGVEACRVSREQGIVRKMIMKGLYFLTPY